MLTKDELAYLSKIPKNKKVSVRTFDPQAKKVGNSIVSKIKKALSNLEVLFMGATALEIAGQNDIDIYVLSKSKDFNKYLPILEKLFGKPKHIHKAFIEWRFKENSYLVELYLTEPPKRQIKVFEVLKSNKILLKKYENLKLRFEGKSFHDYQRAKYEFYHRILEEIDWGKVMKQFEKEMFDKLADLPGHREVLEESRVLRSIISHELPETSPKILFRKLIGLLLSGRKTDTREARRTYLEPELRREKQIIKRHEAEFEKLKESAKGWVERNLTEERLQRKWKSHQTWLPRRYTIYAKQPTFQKIAADTLARFYLLKKYGSKT
ncbi:MAG: GrpB family protein [Candidatus Pacearchaeota archaeon]